MIFNRRGNFDLIEEIIFIWVLMTVVGEFLGFSYYREVKLSVESNRLVKLGRWFIIIMEV